MFRQQLAGLALLLAVTAGAVAADRLFQKEPEPELPVCAVVAPLEGEITSPDGQFYVRQMGADTSVTAAGLYPAERIQVVSRKTGEVLWEDIGYYHQSVLWSPGSRYAAIARRARTYQVVTVIDTHTFLAWDVTLPDGGPIPEYTFLPEDSAWGTWQNENTLLLTVGLGGDSGPRRFYRCTLHSEADQFTGSTLEQTRQSLTGLWDFDKDGAPETAEVVTVWSPEGTAAWYELHIKKEDGSILWSQENFSDSHAGWSSLFACQVGGQDCLLRYTPWMGQGLGAYSYELFTLNGAGEEVLVKKNRVEFDIDAEILDFDPAAIAAFLEEVHGYLAGSTLLLSTEGGSVRFGMDGGEFRDDLRFWSERCPYDNTLSLEQNLERARDALLTSSGG